MKKPIIENIIISGEQMDELISELNEKSTHAKPTVIRKYAGGICMYCGEIPSKKLLYDVGDGDKLVEYYCDKCYERWILINLDK